MATNLLLEGDDLEALLARAAVEGGPSARIVRAEKVRRGGVMGFFAREGFEVAVEIPDAPVAAPPSPASSPATAAVTAAGQSMRDGEPLLSPQALARLAARIEAAEQASAGAAGAAGAVGAVGAGAAATPVTAAAPRAARVPVVASPGGETAVDAVRRLFLGADDVPAALEAAAATPTAGPATPTPTAGPTGPTPDPTGGDEPAAGPRLFAFHEATGGTAAVARALAVLERRAGDLTVTTSAPDASSSPSSLHVPGLAERLAALDLADGFEPGVGDADARAAGEPADPEAARSFGRTVGEPPADPVLPADSAAEFTTLLDTLRAQGKVTAVDGSGSLPGTTILPGGLPAQPAPATAPATPTGATGATAGRDAATSWAIPALKGRFGPGSRAAAAYGDAAVPPAVPSVPSVPAMTEPASQPASQPVAEPDDVEDVEADLVEEPPFARVPEPAEDAEVEDATAQVEDSTAEAEDAAAEVEAQTPVVEPEPAPAPQPLAVPLPRPQAEDVDADELRALLSVPETPQSRVRRPVDTRLAADRRTLRTLGVPGAWTRRLKAGDRFSSVMAMLTAMPELDADPDVPVVAVVGLPGTVVMEAHRVAVDLAVGNRPRRVIVVPTDDAPQRDAALDTALEMDNLVAAVETLALDATHAARVRATLRQLRAALVIAVVDATRPLEETRAWLSGIGRVDALAVEGATDVADPAAALRLNLPVIRLDGIPVDRVTWTALLCAQLDLAERVR